MCQAAQTRPPPIPARIKISSSEEELSVPHLDCRQTMSAEKDTGQPPPGGQSGKESEPVSSASRPKNKSRRCGWKCLAVFPIVVIVLFYNLPYLLDEYEALFGYGLIIMIMCFSLAIE